MGMGDGGPLLPEISTRITNPLHDTIAAVALIFAAAAIWIQSAHFQTQSALFPKMVAIALGALSIIYLGQSVRRMRSESAGAAFFVNFQHWICALILIGLFLYCFPRFGFITSMLVFLPTFVIATGVRKYLFVAYLAVAFSLGTYLVFLFALQRQMPPELILLWLT